MQAEAHVQSGRAAGRMGLRPAAPRTADPFSRLVVTELECEDAISELWLDCFGVDTIVTLIPYLCDCI